MIDRDLVRVFDEYLDREVDSAYQFQPVAQDWARVAKVAEETGEAVAELILLTGQNPRKGSDPSARERLLMELGDVAMTAIYAIQHFTKDIDETETTLALAQGKHRRYMLSREISR